MFLLESNYDTMKIIKYLFLLVSFTILVYQCQPTNNRETESESEYPVLETMGYYQRFSHKLYLAGKNNNWELADFYTHELEEVSEELINADVIHDDYNLSNLSESMLLPKIEQVEGAIRKQDQVLFLENYELMISACNLCHQSTKHDFIQITVPNDSTVWNQKF